VDQNAGCEVGGCGVFWCTRLALGGVVRIVIAKD